MVVSVKSSPVAKKQAAQAFQQPELSVIARVIKGDTYMVMADSAKELEDEFVNLYTTVPTNNSGRALALEPPFNPKKLRALVKQNNILNQCVHAMEVNIDGTGHEFVSVEEGKDPDQTELQIAQSFFNEPYPGRNWIAMRRDLRVDLESIGYGFLEVLRTIAKEVAGIRHVEATSLRMVRLGEPKEITSVVERNGKPVEFKSMQRPRRYVQLLNGVITQYFKEFECPLSLNRKTGEWSDTPLPPADEATELIVFGVDRDISGPYWVPRWINQLPSVIGSRKAEEYNLEFFDSGGMPPAIIFIQGGTMVGAAADQLRTYLSAQNKKKGRAVVVELASNSGSIDSSGSVSARVERFGAEKAGDQMFGKYDAAAEEHVRVGFRLPLIFLGKSNDYNYATAVVAYQVAEAQVFQPERSEFDEVINKTIIRSLGLKTLKFKSNPITLKSIEEKFKGLEMIKENIEAEDLVNEVNISIGTDLKYKEPEEKPVGNTDPLTGLPYDKPVPPAPSPAPLKKSNILNLLSLVRKYAQLKGIADTGWVAKDESDGEAVLEEVKALSADDYSMFSLMVSEYAKGSSSGD